MKWFNADRDNLPGHEQEVLISVNGVYHVAYYDSRTNVFRLKDEPSNHFHVGKHLIYWSPLSNPA